MQRIVVIGFCGAGKSTLARRLGAILDLPVIHIDALNWQPGWIETPSRQLRGKIRQAASADRWIIDGNYDNTLDVRLPRADTVVWIDLPHWQCVCRVIKRFLHYRGKTRPDLGVDCPEKLDMEFLSFVITHYHKSQRNTRRRLAEHAAGKKIIRLRSQPAIDRFLREIAK